MLVSSNAEILFHILFNFQCQHPATLLMVWLVLSIVSLVCLFPKTSRFFAYLNPFSLSYGLTIADLWILNFCKPGKKKNQIGHRPPLLVERKMSLKGSLCVGAKFAARLTSRRVFLGKPLPGRHLHSSAWCQTENSEFLPTSSF